MKVLLTGASGQVSKELIYTCPNNIELIALDKETLDISNDENIKYAFNKYKPSLVINAAAYTSVENAEIEDNIAYKINRDAVYSLANECAKNNIRLIHYSTDYIFDGKKSSPYNVDDKANPINIYGKSKFAGENIALKTYSKNILIIRTSWIYSKHGNNFVKTMLKLMDKGESIEIITDQVGTPTWARSIANTTWKFVEKQEIIGVVHFSDGGSTSWFEFAQAIQESAIKLNIISNTIELKPINSSAYKSKTQRPAYSVLDCKKTLSLINTKPDNWRIALETMLKDLIE